MTSDHLIAAAERARNSGSQALRNRFVHNDGSTLWNVTSTSIAAWLDVPEIEVDFFEDDDGTEQVTVFGVPIGHIERF